MSEASVPAVPEGVRELDIIGVRQGAFGATGSGDTSGFGGLVEPIVLPAPAMRPFGGWFDEVSDEIELSLEATGAARPGGRSRRSSSTATRSRTTCGVSTCSRSRRCCATSPGLRFEMCLGVNGVHYPHESGRELHAVYPFLSITHNTRVRVEVSVPDGDARIPSIVAVYPANDWHERETWDFFGIVFDGHPALTRIMMPDDWPGHPQRKDYPLGGIPVEYKGGTIPPPDQRRSYN